MSRPREISNIRVTISKAAGLKAQRAALEVLPFFIVRQAWRFHLGVQVPYGPGRGNR